MPSSATIHRGSFNLGPKARIALVSSRFNDLVVQPLVQGAQHALQRHGIEEHRIDLIEVPGAWELPWACQRIATAGKHAAIVALGAVVRGATPHFEHVAGAAAQGLARVMLETGVPIGMGLLTTDTLEQALDRAGGKSGNKGADAAIAALELASLAERLSAR